MEQERHDIVISWSNGTLLLPERSLKTQCNTCSSAYATAAHGENIHELVQSILDEWEIPPSKVSAILTDNGSNMIAAFRPQIIESDDDVEDESDQDMESGEDAELSSLVQEFEKKNKTMKLNSMD